MIYLLYTLEADNHPILVGVYPDLESAEQEMARDPARAWVDEWDPADDGGRHNGTVATNDG